MNILAVRGRSNRGRNTRHVGDDLRDRQVQISDVGGAMVISYGGVPHRVPLQRAGMPWRSPATLASPAMIVAGGLEIVPFIDHAGVLADLIRWCEHDDMAGLRVLTGPGGAGKTRTAVRLCQEMEGRHWLAGVLSARADEAELDELARVPTALLVVVEDAATRGGQLATLVPLLAQRAPSGHPTRVLLTHRDHPLRARRLESLRGANTELDRWLSQGPVDQLAECPPDAAARRHLYTGAFRAFAGQLSLPATTVDPPPALADALFSNPQMIVIGAYLGVNGEELVDSASELFERLIEDHEDRYWSWMAGRQVPAVRPDKAVRRQVAALAALAGAHDEDDARRLLAVLDESALAGVDQPELLARWAAALYPGATYWNGPRPEVLKEYLVASTFADDQVAIAGVLGGVAGDRRPESLTQPVGLLARAAVGRPRLASSVSAALGLRLEYLCDQVAAAAATDFTLAAALTELVKVCPPDPAGLPAILDDLPARPERALRPLASVLTQQTETYFRRLAETDPDDHLPNLAVALNNLSVRLADQGRHDEATVANTEAVRHYRRLAENDAAAYQPNLAISLFNLSLRLSDLGRYQEAAATISEAVGHYRALARLDPSGYRPNLATSLYILSLRLTDLGRNDQAAAALAEAVSQYRDLVVVNPDVYRPKLAGSLGDLSLRLAAAGHHEQAVAAISEAVGQYRDLARVDPQRYWPKLAASLGDLSQRLVALGRQQKAMAASIEAVEQYRGLAASDPGYLPDLAESLEDLAQRLAETGRRKEAAARRDEAQAVFGQVRSDRRQRALSAP